MAGWDWRLKYKTLRPWAVGLGLAGLALAGGFAGAVWIYLSINQPRFAIMEAPSNMGNADELGMAPPSADRMMESPLMADPPLVPGTEIGQATPQLVKRASLTLTLTDIDEAMAQVQALVRQAQGDVLSVEDYRSPEGISHNVRMTLRVPQAQLEPTLATLRQLGTVQSQSLSAEDVSSQLVDLSARLKNLRQSEVALQGIMERSGEISHVLEVARELSNVRDSIERLSAQEQNLQRQVAYSTINLNLHSPFTAVPPLRPVPETLGNTWKSATQSVKAFTVGGMKIILWLLAYSPYWVVLALLIYGGYRLRTRRPIPTDAEQPPQP